MPAEKTYSTLSDLIKNVSGLKEAGIHFVESADKDVFRSYYDLYEHSADLAVFLHDKGLRHGDELVFQLNNNQQFIVAFWACILSGVIPIPLAMNTNNGSALRLENVCGVLGSPYFITSRGQVKGQALLPDAGKIIYIEDVNRGRTQDQEFIPSADDIAYLQFSSGSTGMPKGAVLTHRNLLANIRAIHSGIQSPSQGDIFFSWMPLTHDMGLIGFHLTPLFAGWNHYIMPTELFIRNPNLWLGKITEYRITFTSSPNFGYQYVLKYLDRSKWDGLDLSCLRVIVNGAEPISAGICHEFLRKLKPFGLRQDAIFPVYGLAEASLAVTFSKINTSIITLTVDRTRLNIGDEITEVTNLKDGLTLVELGTAVDYCEIRIIGNEQEVLGDRVVGHIQIRGDNVIDRYYRNPTGLIKFEDGWLDTGDLGFLKDQNLYVTGREKDIVFVNGRNYYSFDIERAAENVGGIELGKIVIAGYFDDEIARDKIIAFVFHKGQIGHFIPIAEELKRRLNYLLDIVIDETIPVKEISKTTSGKIQRYRMLEKYRAGEYASIIAEVDTLLHAEKQSRKKTRVTKDNPPTNSIESSLLVIWQKVLGYSNFGIEDKFFEIGGNSLKAAEMAAAITLKWGTELSFSTIFYKQTITAIAQVIRDSPAIGLPLVTGGLDESAFFYLSSSQKRLFYTWEMDRQSIAYNIPFALKIKGSLDRHRLAMAFQKLVERHEMLRMSVTVLKGIPVQQIDDKVNSGLNFLTIQKDETIAVLRELTKPFDLNSEPPVRAYLLSLGDDQFILFIDVHHIVADGISIYLLVNELLKLYRGEVLPPLNTRYRDFVDWESALSGTVKFQKQEFFWKQRFEKGLSVLNLPTVRKKSILSAKNGKKRKISVDRNLVADLQVFASEQQTTLFISLLAIYNVLLYKYTSQENIVVGIPISGRPGPQFDLVVGMFVNNIVLNCFPEGNKPFNNFLDEVKKDFLDAFDNKEYDFLHLAAGQSRKDTGRNPVFDTMFIYQNMEYPVLSDDDLAIERYFFDPGIAKYDLSLEVFDFGGDMEFYLEYNTDLFPLQMIRRIEANFVHLATQLIRNPFLSISETSSIVKEEHDFLISKFNNTATVYPLQQPISELFEEAARGFSDHIALVFGESCYTYGETDMLSTRVAKQLIFSGIKPGTGIGIMMDRSPELVIGILGILKAGAYFLPIDPELPDERIGFLLMDSCVDKLLTTEPFQRRILELGVVLPIFIEPLLNPEVNFVDDCPLPCPQSDSIAYVIYTSGSSGQPKGVMVSHRSLVNYCSWSVKEYFENKQVAIALYTSISFDLTITSIFPPLISGSRIVIYKEQNKALCLEQVIRENKVNIIKLTPSQLKVLTDRIMPTGLEGSIRKIIVGGEQLSTDLARETHLKFKEQADIFNEYGPTEATVGCMIYKFRPSGHYGHAIPIGKPIDNARVYLLDKYLQPVPAGAEGEIYVAGECLSKGYLNRENLTDEKFLPDPFSTGNKMYRTGDKAQLLPDENMEFLGRFDTQMKINGYRVEPTEIEDNLKRHPNIKDAIVREWCSPDGPVYLCAYIVLSERSDFDETAFRNFLIGKIPGYMVPAFYVELDIIPLTHNGKIDTESLPMPKTTATYDTMLSISEMEGLLLEVWQNVLSIGNVGLDDSFFQLGGDSIKAIQIVSKLYNLGYSVEAKDILQYHTISQLTPHVGRIGQERYEQGHVSGRLGLTPMACWFFSQSFIQPEYYNQSVLLTLKTEIHLPSLENAFDHIIRHHDGLRLNYDSSKKAFFFNPLHLVRHFKIEKYTSGISTAAKTRDFLYETGKQIKSTFDIENSLLICAAYIRSGPADSYLLITAHHLIMDGISWRILLEDLYTAYNDLLNSRVVILPVKTASLIDWYKTIVGFSEYGHADITSPRMGFGNQKTIVQELDRKTTEGLLSKVLRDAGIPIEIALLTALLRAQYERYGQHKYVIELEGHGRPIGAVNVSRTVGWFTDLRILELRLTGDSISGQITSLKQQVNDISTTDHLSFRQAELRFNYMGQFDFEKFADLFEISNADTGPDTGPHNHPTADIELVIMVQYGRLRMMFHYNDARLNDDHAALLVETYIKNIRDIIDYYSKNKETLSFTPADFKLADLSQAEIDSLLS